MCTVYIPTLSSSLRIRGINPHLLIYTCIMHVCVLYLMDIWACSNQQETYCTFHSIITSHCIHACKVEISYGCYFDPHPILACDICKWANGFLLSGGKGDFACHFVSIPLEQRGSVLCKLPVASPDLSSSHLFQDGANELFLLFLLSGGAEDSLFWWSPSVSGC